MPLPSCAESPDIENCSTLAVSARLMPVTHRPSLARAPKPALSPESRWLQGSEVSVSSRPSGRSAMRTTQSFAFLPQSVSRASKLNFVCLRVNLERVSLRSQSVELPLLNAWCANCAPMCKTRGQTPAGTLRRPRPPRSLRQDLPASLRQPVAAPAGVVTGGLLLVTTRCNPRQCWFLAQFSE